MCMEFDKIVFYFMQNDDEYDSKDEDEIDAVNSNCQTNHKSFLLKSENK